MARAAGRCEQVLEMAHRCGEHVQRTSKQPSCNIVPHRYPVQKETAAWHFGTHISHFWKLPLKPRREHPKKN